jgi:hypothetical protein
MVGVLSGCTWSEGLTLHVCAMDSHMSALEMYAEPEAGGSSARLKCSMIMSEGLRYHKVVERSLSKAPARCVLCNVSRTFVGHNERICRVHFKLLPGKHVHSILKQPAQ